MLFFTGQIVIASSTTSLINFNLEVMSKPKTN